MCLAIGISTAGHAATPALNHVVVVAFENHSYAEVAGSPAMPYLNSLIQQYGLATNFVANAPGSVPDYFMMTTGQEISQTTNIPTPVTVNNLVRALHGVHKSWKAYAQSIPSAGYLGPSVYPYIKYHNPFAYFSDVIDSPAQAAKIVPLSQLASDVASDALPNFMYILPDNEHNAHDCPDGGTSCTDAEKLQAADRFLQDHIPALLNTASFQDDGLLFIWWDEGSETGGGEQVAIVLVGPVVKKGFRSGVFYQHQHVLRTIVEGLQLGSYPGASLNVSSMSDFFSEPAAPLDFTVSASPSSATITAGGSATYTITLKALNGSFSTAPTLGCGDLPTDSTCAFTTPVSSAAGTVMTSTVTISTTARAVASAIRLGAGAWLSLLFPVIGFTLLVRPRCMVRRGTCVAVGVCLLLTLVAGALVSCSGLSGSGNGTTGTGPAPPSGGTSAGSYTIQLQASTTNFTHTTKVTLVVQ